jgi:hypothetical protein
VLRTGSPTDKNAWQIRFPETFASLTFRFIGACHQILVAFSFQKFAKKNKIV